MRFLTHRKLNLVEVDKHREVNVVKAELRATAVEINSRDEERQRRIECILLMVAVPAATFFISNLGFFRGLLLMVFCSAMFCVTYAPSFLRFTGGTNIQIPLSTRFDTAYRKIAAWIRLIVEDLSAPRNEG